MVYVFVILLCVALDQALKLWTVANLELYSAMPLLPGIVELTRVHNYGAAWSSFSGQRWLLIGVSSAIVLAVAVLVAVMFAACFAVWLILRRIPWVNRYLI